jgi:hypothetical protein
LQVNCLLLQGSPQAFYHCPLSHMLCMSCRQRDNGLHANHERGSVLENGHLSHACKHALPGKGWSAPPSQRCFVIACRAVDGLTSVNSPWRNNLSSALVTKDHSPPLTDQHLLSHMQTCAAGQRAVQLLNLAVLVRSFFNLVRENACHTFNRMPFLRAHLRWVELPLGRNLLNRLVTAQRLERHCSFKSV